MPIEITYVCWNCKGPLDDWIVEFYCRNCIMIVNRERAYERKKIVAQKGKLSKTPDQDV